MAFFLEVPPRQNLLLPWTSMKFRHPVRIARTLLMAVLSNALYGVGRLCGCRGANVDGFFR